MTDQPADNPDAGPYVGRAYERDLVDSGRRIVSLDIDADLLCKIDEMRRPKGIRRGLALDQIIRAALYGSEMAMT